MNLRAYTIDELKAKSQYSCVGGPFGSELTRRHYVDSGVPVIRGNNLPADRYFLNENFVFVSDQKANALLSNLAYPGDLVFTQRGTLGQVGIIPKNGYERYLLSQSQMKLTVNEEIVRSEFLYFYFRQRSVVELIKSRAASSGVPHINLGILKSLMIRIPSLEAQDRIVSVLSAYQDLIESNRRRIQLLEQAANMLYQEWFVRLNFPGREHVKIQNGVPQGWSKVSLGQAAVLNYGKALKEDDRIRGPFPVYGSSGIVGTHDSVLAKGPAIIVGRKGNVGSVFWSYEDFWAIDTVYFISSEQSSFCLYYALLNTSFISTDVAVPGLNRDFAHSKGILIPEPSLVSYFEDIASTLHAEIHCLQRYNARLVNARDLLLPRLMNGELSVEV